MTGPNLQGNRQALSDTRGGFRVLALPPATYTVRLTCIGYGPIRYEGVRIQLGTTTSLGDIYLDPQPVEIADIVVSGAKPVIDPASRCQPHHPGFLAVPISLPSGRDFRALIPFVPQANASSYSNADPYSDDGVNIAGSTGLENAFYVDGMNVTVITGNSVDLPFNFVRESRSSPEATRPNMAEP